MENKTRDILYVLCATVAALGLLGSGIALTRGPVETPLRADSANQLVELSFEKEEESLRKQLQLLGPKISDGAINGRWEVLKWQMEETGMNSKAASGVLSGVANAKCATLKSSDVNPRLWPVFTKPGWVRNKKVQIVYLAYWRPRTPQLIEGMFSVRELQEMDKAFRVYVISADAPYQCWIRPFQLDALPKEERRFYTTDFETLQQQQAIRETLLYLKNRREKTARDYAERERQYERQRKYDLWRHKKRI